MSSVLSIISGKQLGLDDDKNPVTLRTKSVGDIIGQIATLSLYVITLPLIFINIYLLTKFKGVQAVSKVAPYLNIYAIVVLWYVLINSGN